MSMRAGMMVSMEDWVKKALARWPNVPALFGWLGLDRRGRWLIRGETISRPQIIETINRNYAGDEHGRWYFQNGPQRGYVTLGNAPLVLRAPAQGEVLSTHTELAVRRIGAAWLDEEGGLLLETDLGPGALADHDLEWALQRLECAGGEVDEERLGAALALPSGTDTGIGLRLADTLLPVHRLDRAQAPARLGFVRDPQSRPGERTSPGTDLG
jgi:hypothetical protein